MTLSRGGIRGPQGQQDCVSEHVLVVPRSRLFPRGPFQGFSREELPLYLAVIARDGFFARRDRVEEDPSLKQIIPYVVLRHRDRIFLVKRTHGGGEARLRDKYSVGLGGHITPADQDAGDLLEAGMARELREEVDLPPRWRARVVGLLNDDQEPVGRVHFGVVYQVDVPEPTVRVRETTKLSGEFATPEQVREVYHRLESWSRYVVDGLALVG